MSDEKAVEFYAEEHKNKSMSMQAPDKGPGTEERLGLEEACGEGSFHSQHHGHS